MRNLTLLLIVLALGGTLATGVLGWRLSNQKRELTAQLDTTTARLTATEVQLRSLENEHQDLKDRSRTLDADLAAAKRDLSAKSLEIEQMHEAIAAAEREREMALTARNTAQADLHNAHVEVVALRQQLDGSVSPAEAQRYRRTIADLESRIGELEQFIVRQDRNPALVAGRAQHAQILKVGPRNAFVVINYGSVHGATPNQRFQLKRGAQALAQAEISLVKEHYSIAQVLPESLSGNIRKGDAAFLTP